jgi:hypothetical protein
MNKLRCLIVLALLVPSAIFAAKEEGPKAKTMAKYDLDRDGKLSTEETASLQKDFTAAPSGDLARFDADKDGKLTDDELAKIIPGSGKKAGGDKKAKSTDEKKAGGNKKSEGAKPAGAGN